ncbi:uncharacterized protein LOC131947621 [Physella acuta]|uniref:uncharacterized protein LOC131947621 n=1 Tax=Physella acuta TaxID=109671 RepID=UPI0027DC478F|nr:uncharacterized protein LOC131947621 [Physella acuta]
MLIVFIAHFMAVLAQSAASFNCPSLFNFYPDVHDCTKFYRCIWGKGAAFNCPTETLWSQELLTCNHAKEVKCDKPPVSDELKLFEAPDFSVDIASAAKKQKYETSYGGKYAGSTAAKDAEGYNEEEEDDEEGDESSSEDREEEGNEEEAEDKANDDKENEEEDNSWKDKSKREGDTKDNFQYNPFAFSNYRFGYYPPPPFSRPEYHNIVSPGGMAPLQQHVLHPSSPYVMPHPSQYQPPPYPPQAAYYISPPKYLIHSPKQLPFEQQIALPRDPKSPWYQNSFLYNKLLPVPHYGSHVMNPYYASPESNFEVVNVDVTPTELDRMKVYDPLQDKPRRDDDLWGGTDLFRAGYGYKIIYHK